MPEIDTLAHEAGKEPQRVTELVIRDTNSSAVIKAEVLISKNELSFSPGQIDGMKGHVKGLSLSMGIVLEHTPKSSYFAFLKS